MSDQLDLLIINPYHDEFYYVPMGSFAIARFLKDNGYNVRILNLALANSKKEVGNRLEQALWKYEPRHIGVVFHWKETMHSAMTAAMSANRLRPNSRIWVGGITASAYAQEILSSAPYIDGVIRGDAELPILQILQDLPPSGTANFFYRGGTRVIAPTSLWVANDEFLNNLIYGDLSFIDDLRDYLTLLDTRLGVPLAGSRGCWHDCGYCGGSRSAFRAHSGRNVVSARHPTRFVDDLSLAYRYGARTFLISQPAKRCELILAEISRRYGSRLDFTIHLEPWEIPSRAALVSYASIRFDGRLTPQLLLSVHGSHSTESRKRERQAILDTTRFIVDNSSEIHVTIFDGYFCPWQKDQSELDEALAFVVRARRRFAGKAVSVALMAYSTDPESPWSKDPSLMKSALGIGSISRGLLATTTVADNLLLSRPIELSEAQASHFMATLNMNDRLFQRTPILWFALAELCGEPGFLALLSEISRRIYIFESEFAYPSVSGSDFDLVILAAVENKLRGDIYDRPDERLLYLAEFSSLMRAAAQAQAHKRRTTDGNAREEDLLVFDRQTVHESSFSFDRLFACWRSGLRTDSFDFRAREDEVGQFFYTLLPKISEALPISELQALMCFDGLRPTSDITSALAANFGAPIQAINARVSDLTSFGIIRAI
ncbi:cobalamin-dependent protein [Bradyrhizobium elkanii]